MDLNIPCHPPDAIPGMKAAISDALLRESRRLREPNFTVIGADDLHRLFRLYDERFFNSRLAQAVLVATGSPLTFRLSSTMTRAGGKTIRTMIPQESGRPKVLYEIAIASRMLFMTFGDIDRPVVVCGLVCNHRLDALQRIMEHEIIHLFELLKWGKSSCSANRFRGLANRIFGHTGTKHELVTPRERAAVTHGIRTGDVVEFQLEGVRHIGRVNRIHHRATVLVEAGDGTRYTDGKRYKKFYVPLPWLHHTSSV